jgi:zinc/manganese transport system ATP-binding protein
LSAVVLQGVSLGYARRPILSAIDIAIQDGEFVGLFGANGAGKTTLLRALQGLVRPFAGTITVLGAPARPGREGIGSLPQTRDGEVPSLRGLDVLRASVRGQDWGLPFLRAAERDAVYAALDEVGARALARRSLASLSGGERQLVLIAQALLGAPRLLLLDEPMAGLDPRHQHDVAQLLRRLQRKFGLTVLCSAHDLNVLLPVMDRVLYLGGGSAALGTVEQVVTPPVLSRLYGAPIDVVQAGGRIFVSAAVPAA